jgi:phage shock protein A
MVEKKTQQGNKRGNLDQHYDAAGPQYESLERRLVEFIVKLDKLTQELNEIKQQQKLLTDMIKNDKPA